MKTCRRSAVPGLLAFLAVALLAASSAMAIDFSYSTVGFDSSMPAACEAAVRQIRQRCDSHGPIATDPLSCDWITFPIGVQTRVCRCLAVTTYCAVENPNPLFP